MDNANATFDDDQISRTAFCELANVPKLGGGKNREEKGKLVELILRVADEATGLFDGAQEIIASSATKTDS